MPLRRSFRRSTILIQPHLHLFLQCSADLPHSIRMGRVEVGCEGWDHSSDPYILKGSCGLEYTLLKSFDDGQSQSYQSTSCESIIPDSTSSENASISDVTASLFTLSFFSWKRSLRELPFQTLLLGSPSLHSLLFLPFLDEWTTNNSSTRRSKRSWRFWTRRRMGKRVGRLSRFWRRPTSLRQVSISSSTSSSNSGNWHLGACTKRTVSKTTLSTSWRLDLEQKLKLTFTLPLCLALFLCCLLSFLLDLVLTSIQRSRSRSSGCRGRCRFLPW